MPAMAPFQAQRSESSASKAGMVLSKGGHVAHLDDDRLERSWRGTAARGVSAISYMQRGRRDCSGRRRRDGRMLSLDRFDRGSGHGAGAAGGRATRGAARAMRAP